MDARIRLIVLIGVLAVAQAAEAQVMQRPERAISGVFGGGTPPDPTRTSHDLMLSLNTLGAYDNGVSSESNPSVEPFTPRQMGYNAYAGSMLRYRRLSNLNLFEMGGGAYVNSYRSVGQKPGVGGEVNLRFRNRIGERHDLDLTGSARSDPFYELATFGPLQGIAAAGILPQAGSAEGFSMRRSHYLWSSASVGSRWSPRVSTSASIRYADRDFEDNLGDGGTGSATFSYTHIIGRRSSLVSAYTYTDSEFLSSPNGYSPRTTHTVDFGYHYDRPFSPTRGITIGFGAGATRVQTASSVAQNPLEYVTPAGYANMRLRVARSWSIRADYRRDVSVLEGLTPEPFNTDAAMAHVGGLIHRRVELVVSGGYSRGHAGVTPEGHYRSYAGGTQLRFSMSRLWSAVVGHTYYAYQLRDVTQLPVGLRTRMNRHTLRVGMTLSVPLYGTFTRTSATQQSQ